MPRPRSRATDPRPRFPQFCEPCRSESRIVERLGTPRLSSRSLYEHALAVLRLGAAFQQWLYVAGDQSRAAVVADIGPRPFDDHDEPVAKSDQKKDVHE